VDGVRAGGMLFATGMQRSGTTLIGRLLDAHPAISVMSQPFPLLFVETRREYLRVNGAEQLAYPLGPQFLEPWSQASFDQFLGRHALDHSQLYAVFRAMEQYSGQCTRFSAQAWAAALRECPTTEFAAQLHHLYGALSPRSDATWVGGKETLCETFAPHLLGRGARVVVILRDPRDVIASLNHGEGRRWTGSPKPTLFNLRQWRKSVALACSYADEEGLLVLRYEAVIADPKTELARVAHFLGVEAFEPPVYEAVMDGGSDRWVPNSSFGGRNAAGRHRDVLPKEVTAYIEACCLPELRKLGYDTSMSRAIAAETIRSFVDPYPIERVELQGYGRNLADVEAELYRLALLDSPGDEDRVDYFLFPRAHRALAEAWQ
jgi:hypothetical protein